LGVGIGDPAAAADTLGDETARAGSCGVDAADVREGERDFSAIASGAIASTRSAMSSLGLPSESK